MSKLKDFSPSRLLQIARERTGLNNFGPDDFREPFEILIEEVSEIDFIPEDRKKAVSARRKKFTIFSIWNSLTP